MSKLSDTIGAFTTIPNTVIDMIPKIGPEAFTLWSYLRFRTNGQSGVAFPSYNTIYKDTGLHPRKIAEALRRLETWELVTRNKRFGRSTEYTLRMPSPTTIGSNGHVDSPTNGDTTVIPMVSHQSYQRRQTNKIDKNKIDKNKIDLSRELPVEPMITNQGQDPEAFKAVFTSIESAMPHSLNRHECETIRDLWNERPDLDAHHYAFLQTVERADGFNLRYYESCLEGYNGNTRQLSFIEAAAARISRGGP